MIQLSDAICKTFPQGNQWAGQALEALSDELEPTTFVHGVVEGWMRRGVGSDAELIDTLFILTGDRLGMGRTDEAPGERRWLLLPDVVAVDAVDDSPLPLQTIEIELKDGTVVCVGWPESFSDRLVAALVAVVDGGGSPTDAMPRELADPAALADDVSDLDSLAPSGWVESDVTVVTETPVDPTTPLAEGDAMWFTDPPPEGPPATVAAIDFFNTPPPPPVAPQPLTGPGSIPDSGPAAWMAFDAQSHAQPLADNAFESVSFEPDAFLPGVPAEPSSPMIGEFDPFTPAGSPYEPAHHPAPDQRQAPAGPPPWEHRGMVWPDPLRGVLYLGGHPSHSRKRKNGSMVFSPMGLHVKGSGFQDWEMNMDWAFVDRLEIQGPDEIMFGDHLKIDSTSSALVIRMADQTRMFFEIRTRRPPSLRSTLAPVLQMVDDIRAYRVGNN